MNITQHLKFFNKNGDDCNFNYLDGVWYGSMYMPKVSTGLFETAQLFCVQKYSNELYGLPLGTETIVAEWETSDPETIFMFNYESVETGNSSLFVEQINASFNKVDKLEFKLQTEQISSALTFNFAFTSNDESTYAKTVVLKIKETDEVFAKINVYAESIEEDERLKSMTEFLGYEIAQNDHFIFKDSDVEEALPDFIKLNKKRKEIILEGKNIYPYIGTYKALINTIKYFGYNQLNVTEFWKNVDTSSPHYGKRIQSEPIELNTTSIDKIKLSVPNKKWRKTNLFNLIYRINKVVPNRVNHLNLPMVEEVYDFTIEEVLIKLFGLKKKLELDFLPLNSKIQDIVGEADFFAGTSLKNNTSLNVKNNVNAGVTCSFDVLPNKFNYIEDLRNFAAFCYIQEPVIASSAVQLCTDGIGSVSQFELDLIGRNIIMGDALGQLAKSPIGPDTTGASGDVVSGTQYTLNDLNDMYLIYFSRFNKSGEKWLKRLNLPDNENAPIGSLVVLNNTSFEDLSWNNAISTWVDLTTQSQTISYDFIINNHSVGDTFIMKLNDDVIDYVVQTDDTLDDVILSLIALAEVRGGDWSELNYEKINESYGKGIRAKGNNSSIIEVRVDKSIVSIASFLKISSTFSLYSWDTITTTNFTEIEWVVIKEETETPEFNFTVRGPIWLYNKTPLVLPYVGEYHVELKLYDMYNNISSRVELSRIVVEPKEIEITGSYYELSEKQDWFYLGKYNWDEMTSSWTQPFEPLTIWEDSKISWNSLNYAKLIKNNISQDESMHIQNYQHDGSVSFPGSYNWHNLENVSWLDGNLIWWDGTKLTGDITSMFSISEIIPVSYLKIVDLNGNEGIHYFDATQDDFYKQANALNLSDDPIIRRYVYNVVEWDLFEDKKPLFIQAVCRYEGSIGDWTSLEMYDTEGNTVGSFDTSNIEQMKRDAVAQKTETHHYTNSPTWTNFKPIIQGVNLKKLNWAMFTYDQSKIASKQKPKWKIINTNTNKSVELEGERLCYLFKETGNYSIELQLTDFNTNKYIKRKNLISIK